MSVDLTKLVLYSGNPAFKNNDIYTGSKSMSGNENNAINFYTASATLPVTPDFTQILLSSDQNTWTDYLIMDVQVDDSVTGNNYPTKLYISPSLSGSTVTFTGILAKQYVSTGTLHTSTFYYRIVDYSVF